VKKVLFMQPIYPTGVEWLKGKVEFAEPPKDAYDPESVKRAVAEAQGVIVRVAPFTGEMVRAAPRLEVIGRYGVGVDNVDVDTATRLGIPVVYTPLGNYESVAESAIGMMLALAKKLPEADRASRSGNYQARLSFIAMELRGKVLGVVGLGRVGGRVAEIAGRGLEMKTVTYDPYIPQERAASLRAELVDNLDDLLRRADIVTLHTPLTPETRHLIGGRELALMKPTAFLINTARGAVVDEAALIEALREGRIAGAGLDVFEPEPPRPDNPLFAMENVILAPHVAAHTTEALGRVSLTVCQQVYKVLSGERPDFIANPEVWGSRGAKG